MRLLYVTANPKPVHLSYSLQVGSHFLETLQQLRSDVVIEKVDVYQDHIPPIDADVFTAWGKLEAGKELNSVETATLARMSALLEQFLTCDVYVFVSPLWNLSYPPMLKAYLDNVVVAGKTFQYTPTGAIGLLQGTGKKAIHIQAAGGVHSSGPVPEYANAHLQGILKFIGIDEYHYIASEGMAFDPSSAQAIVDAAKLKAAEVAQVIAAGS